MPDLIIFSFGTNEAYEKNLDTNKYFDELNSFISKLNEELPNTAFIITTAPDTRSQGKIPPNQIIINDQLIKIAKSQDVSIFDLNKAMGGWGSLNKWYKNKLVAEDKLHFTAAGYSLQGKLFSMAFLESYNAKSTNRKLDLSNLRNEILLGIKPVLGKITKSPVVIEPIKEEPVKEEPIKKEQVIKEPVKKEKKNNDLPKIYIVKKGDSIYRIARKYKLDPNKVLRLNKLKEQAIINVGQKIVLY
jgi:LysM repeat protein